MTPVHLDEDARPGVLTCGRPAQSGRKGRMPNENRLGRIIGAAGDSGESPGALGVLTAGVLAFAFVRGRAVYASIIAFALILGGGSSRVAIAQSAETVPAESLVAQPPAGGAATKCIRDVNEALLSLCAARGCPAPC